jgi:hypothetical protein
MGQGLLHSRQGPRLAKNEFRFALGGGSMEDEHELMIDQQLLSEFVTRGSERAFESLVRRHVNLVFATALRHSAVSMQ